jgi:hypothetical protein
MVLVGYYSAGGFFFMASVETRLVGCSNVMEFP